MKLTRKQFEDKYFSMTNDELAKELGMTQNGIVYYVKKFGIKNKGKGFHRKIEMVD